MRTIKGCSESVNTCVQKCTPACLIEFVIPKRMIQCLIIDYEIPKMILVKLSSQVMKGHGTDLHDLCSNWSTLSLQWRPLDAVKAVFVYESLKWLQDHQGAFVCPVCAFISPSVISTRFIEPPQDPAGLACQRFPPGELAGTGEERQRRSGWDAALREPAGPRHDHRYTSGKRQEQLVPHLLHLVMGCVGTLIENTEEGEWRGGVFTSCVVKGSTGVFIIVGGLDASWHRAQICN